ncbi:3-hydroxybutyrate dehydrogenase [Psychrosphaera ytuae]|uniref:3-hydroxybutyrate dehydrogenase n=1 Tax=Psychrosphaera ytuae TaxID=2820710 RepID=A0A975HIP6_9GAMM|nr:3-hydroxybutyrate dehydrogenase [Psychrosphaera ytuae]QTH64470.1 3-hydroxybutyrate dehydrogenase [Psychrosphaera ytuae]
MAVQVPKHQFVNAPLTGKVALVTGSTSGIGLASAHKLAQQGCNVIIHGLVDQAQGKELQGLFERTYEIKSAFSDANLAEVKEIDQLFSVIQAKFGRLDIVVNNAGVQYTETTEKFPLERWQMIININLTAAFYITQKALPLMHENNWGRIINIASVHGLVGSVNKSAYVAAKHGLVGFTKVVAMEQANRGVTVNAICPGWVETPLINDQIDAIAKHQSLSFDDAKKQLVTAKQPLENMTSPDQIGDLVSFLCSDSASTMTGSALTIDGGWTAQ